MSGYDLKAYDAYDFKTWNSLQTGTENQGIAGTVRAIADSFTRLYGYNFHNNDPQSDVWVQLFFRPAGEVVLGVTPPDRTVRLQTGEDVEMNFKHPLPCWNGLSIACTTLETNATGASIAATGTVDYK